MRQGVVLVFTPEREALQRKEAMIERETFLTRPTVERCASLNSEPQICERDDSGGGQYTWLTPLAGASNRAGCKTPRIGTSLNFTRTTS